MSQRRLLLALESATSALSVAIVDERAVLAERDFTGAPSQAEQLLGLIDSALQEAQVSLEQLAGFAISIGPGSFTGLRVGVATVKGLALGSSQAGIPVSTLAALAWGAGESARPVAPVLNAQRGEIYAAVYAADGKEQVPEGVYRPEEFAALLPRDCLLVGEASERYGAVLAQAARYPVQCAPPRAPRARWVGELALRALERGEGCAIADLVPRYFRRAEAEVRRTGLRFEERG